MPRRQGRRPRSLRQARSGKYRIVPRRARASAPWRARVVWAKRRAQRRIRWRLVAIQDVASSIACALRVVAAALGADVERVVGVVEDLERRQRPEPIDDRADQIEPGELVAGALQEQHRHVDRGEMRGALGARLAGGMQGEADEHEAAHSRQCGTGLGLRRHPPAEGFAACEQRQACSKRCRFGDRGPDRGCAAPGVGALRAFSMYANWKRSVATSRDARPSARRP